MTNNVEDELAVRNLLSRYSDAVWRVDHEAFAATWAEDGRWEILGMVMEGREALVSRWGEFMDQVVRNWQIIHGEILKLEPEHGTGKIYVNEVMTELSGATKLTMGIYEDEYVKLKGQWYFRSRKFNLVYLGSPDYSTPFAEPAGFPKGK